MSHGVIGELIQSAELEWKIPNFSTLHYVSNLDFYESKYFKFANTYWNLRIFRGTSSKFRTVLLKKKDGVFCDAVCSLSIKKIDDSLYGTQTRNVVTSHFFTDFIDRSTVQQRDFKLMPSDTLTIVCVLEPRDHREQKRKHAESSKVLNKRMAVGNVEQSGLADLNLLSEKIKGFFTVGEFCDVTLRVKGNVFKAHRIILAARSPVFASYFKHETSEKQSGIVNITDCDPDSFRAFLEYLYSGKLENISFTSALHLYRTSEKYDVQELKMFCVEYMKRNFNAEFICDVVSLADLYDDVNLSDAAQEFFNSNLSDIFATTEWKNFMKNNHILANKLLIEMSSCVEVVTN